MQPIYHKDVQEYRRDLTKHKSSRSKTLLCEEMTLVNTKILHTNIPKQMVTTKDNVAINIDSIVYWHIMDPFISIYYLANINEALKQRTMPTLRDTVGVYSLQGVVENRKAHSESIKGIIGKTASSWGIFIESILINDLAFVN